MAHKIVTFGPGSAGIRTVGENRVYMRTNWADAWELQPKLSCLEASWSANSSMPTASIQAFYGVLKHPGDVAFAIDLKLTDVDRLYVKVEFDSELDAVTGIFATRNWYGFVNVTQDELGGAVFGADNVPTATGKNLLHCFGMEKMLADHKINRSVFTHNAAPSLIDIPLTFNRGGQPDMTAADVGPVRVFEEDLTVAEFWNSYQIVRYLLDWQTPRDKDFLLEVPFVLAAGASAIIPNWDKPTIETEDITTLALLNRLIDLRRMLGWYATVNGSNEVEIVPFTFTEAAINFPALPGAPTVPANGNTRHLVFDEDQLTNASVNETNVDVFDQVVVLGALRRSVGTFSFTDGTLATAWDTGDETEYEEGASPYAAGTGQAEKEARNTEVRSRTKYADVYARFKIPLSWNRKVKDGIGGTESPLFPVGDPIEADPFEIYYPLMFIEQSMPLYEDTDYTGDKIPNVTYDEVDSNKREMNPKVIFKIPGTSPARYVDASEIGESSFLEIVDEILQRDFSCHVSVPPDSPSIRVDVEGNVGQHAIAFFDFTPLAGVDKLVGEWDFRDAIFTFSIAEHRRVEGKYPVYADLPNQDAILIKYIDAGDSYALDYVAPDTVLGVAKDGTLLRSDGGFVDRLGNTIDQLEALAKLSAAYYTRQHVKLELSSYRLKNFTDIQIGDLVTEIGDPRGVIPATPGHRQVINSVITELTIRTPLGSGQSQPDPQMELSTFAGELDPFQFFKSPEPVAKLRSSVSSVSRAKPPDGLYQPGRGGSAIPLRPINPT